VPNWGKTWDILDRISDAVFVLDGDLRVRHANPAALLMLGVDEHTIDSQPLELFVSHHKVFLFECFRAI
jgi:PAS domain-containing protein